MSENRLLVNTYPLQFPKTIDGIEYKEISIRRLTAKEVADWFEEVRILSLSNPDAPTPDLPMIAAPRDVLDQLDDDDMLMLEEASNDFLPRRLKSALKVDEKSVSSPVTGKPSEPSSAAT